MVIIILSTIYQADTLYQHLAYYGEGYVPRIVFGRVIAGHMWELCLGRWCNVSKPQALGIHLF
jgi:hypothetical protein